MLPVSNNFIKNINMDLLLPILYFQQKKRTTFLLNVSFYANHQLPFLKMPSLPRGTWTAGVGACRTGHWEPPGSPCTAAAHSECSVSTDTQHNAMSRVLHCCLKDVVERISTFQNKAHQGIQLCLGDSRKYKEKIFVHCQTEKLPFNPVFKVRLHFAAGSTTGCTKRFEYSYNK